MDPALHNLLKKAAQLRACGVGWAEVAAAVNRKRNTVEHWPGQYPQEWRREFQRAADTFIATAGLDALKRQQALGRDADDERVRQSANHSIMALWAKLFAQRHEVSGPEGAAQEIKFRFADEGGRGDDGDGQD